MQTKINESGCYKTSALLDVMASPWRVNCSWLVIWGPRGASSPMGNIWIDVRSGFLFNKDGAFRHRGSEWKDKLFSMLVRRHLYDRDGPISICIAIIWSSSTQQVKFIIMKMAYTPYDYTHSVITVIVLQNYISARDRIMTPQIMQLATWWSPIKLVVALKAINQITTWTTMDLHAALLLRDIS